jgi:hypothetical protein
MTWAKFGDQYADECADAGLSAEAFRLHTEAILWLYRLEHDDCRILKHLVRRFAGGDVPEAAAKELAEVGFWRDNGASWVIVHHAQVIRQSLDAQRAKRDRDRGHQRAKRRRDRKVSVTDSVAESVETQTTNQTTSTKGGTILADYDARVGVLAEQWARDHDAF